MIYKYFTVLFVALLVSTSSFSQQTVNRANFCAHDHELYQKVQTDPAFARLVDSIEQYQEQHLANYKANPSRSGTIYYIPVVYHVLHEGGVENISREQILSDLKDLNDSFRKRNANNSQVVPAFRARSADIEIEFRLAQKKNDGTCFSGITRTFSAATNTGGNPAADAVKAAHGDFPGDKYMNIYVAKNIGGAAGYTFRPGGPYFSDMRNGIHVLHTYCGNIGTSVQQGYNATMPHEAGHWLNVAHPWGNSNTPGLSTNCSRDDGIGDTPNTEGWTSCVLGGTTCGSLDNVENIMDYSYCAKMFTEGQKTRMRAAITSIIGGRSNVITAANHAATGIFDDILCQADFSSEAQSICQYEPIQYFDASYHNATSWSWSFPGGTPSTSTDQNPTVTYNNPGRHTVTLTVSNASGTLSSSKTQYIRVVPSWGAPLPYSEGFELSDAQFADKWQVNSSDTSNSWTLANSAYSGSKSVMLRNFNKTQGITSELISESINLSASTSAMLSFRYAYARKSISSGESFQLLVSGDCGNSWVILRGLNVTAPATDSEYFPNTGNEWRFTNVTIPSFYFGENFRFMFRGTNGGGNNFFIDDININRSVGIDEANTISELNLYPNPMSSFSTLDLNLSKESDVSVTLLNMVGQQVQTIVGASTMAAGSNKIIINKGNLVPGVYMVNIELNGTRRIEKLIIQ